jgi:serine phosphatase RsbU (regulator of sigma subunit)
VLRGVERVLLAERRDEEHFATVAMVSLAPELTRAELILCGHPAPLLVRGGVVQELEVDAMPVLTMLHDAVLQPLTIDLQGGWGLLLFTDGLVEGSTIPGSSERLGVGAVADHLRSLLQRGVPSVEVAPALLSEAERRHGGPLTDDVAVMLVGGAGWWTRAADDHPMRQVDGR